MRSAWRVGLAASRSPLCLHPSAMLALTANICGRKAASWSAYNSSAGWVMLV